MPRPKKHKTNADRQRDYRQRKRDAFRNANVLRNHPDLLKITRMPIRYYGGKTSLAEWIIGQFPPHTCYVEPFCGGASVMLSKKPATCEVMNDLNRDVVVFFETLRDRTEELIRSIWCTPYSRDELTRARKEVPTDELDQARKFYIRCWQSFGSGVGKSSTGWRFQKGDGETNHASAVKLWNKTEHLWAIAERLKLVQIECDDAFKVIQRFDAPRTLFYIDPPYVHSTRYHNSSDKGYRHEMTDEDHRSLATLLNQIKGMAVVSGYPSSLYDELFDGWHCVQKQARNVNGGTEQECLWLSPNVTQLANLPMFSAQFR